MSKKIAVFLLTAGLMGAADRILRVSEQRGAAYIVFASGRTVPVPKDPSQVGISDASVAPDGRSAGWLVNGTAATIDYPIQFTLIVWRPGRPVRRFEGGPTF